MRPGNTKTAIDWIETSPELEAVAKRFGRLSRREHRDRLACGAIAERTLKRYDRKLNAARFAEYVSAVNEKAVTRETINDYRNAYRMYRLWRVKCGGPPPALDITKLATAYRAGPAHFTDEDKVKLCERSAEQGLTRARIRDEARRISKERAKSNLKYKLVPRNPLVQNIDGLDLLRNCESQSAAVVILDWMYKPYCGPPDNPNPKVHLPRDPISHICRCIAEAARVLSPTGIIAFFDDHRDDYSNRVLSAFKDAELKRYDQYIHQRRTGGFSGAVGAIFSSAHESIDIYRKSSTTDFQKRLEHVSSVSPRWHARSHLSSGETAVHPFEKPIELMRNLIRPVTTTGLVVDPFAGSGSAGVAAVQLGCQFVGAELVTEYVEIANKRIALAVDRDCEIENAVNSALTEANDQERAAIENYLDRWGIKLDLLEEAA